MRGEARLRGLERAVADYLLKDHKPSASQGEARLRGLWQIIYSKTIISVIAWGASSQECSTRTVADGFSPTATHGGHRIGGRL
jgi:hypothetical protein